MTISTRWILNTRAWKSANHCVSLVDESLARIYLERFAGGKRFAHIDFRRFSRYADPKMTQYRFTFDGLLKR